jgi:hypothetical protein
MNLVDLLNKADNNLIGRKPDDGVLYEDLDVRAKSTKCIKLSGNGLLAMLDSDPVHVSFIVLMWASGDAPILWEPVFSGSGPSSSLRELRHTNWGDKGYIYYPNAELISDAFAKLKTWFDCN